MSALPSDVEVELVDDAEEEGGGRGRLLVIILVVLLVVGGGGGAAWWLLGGSADADEPRELVEGEIVTLESLTTTTGEAQLRHARVGIALVLAEGERADQIASREPLLMDALLREVAGMEADELRSREGSERLRQRMTVEAQSIWGEEVVLRVVLVELLIQ